jgi:hypothetical protein
MHKNPSGVAVNFDTHEEENKAYLREYGVVGVR